MLVSLVLLVLLWCPYMLTSLLVSIVLCCDIWCVLFYGGSSSSWKMQFLQFSGGSSSSWVIKFGICGCFTPFLITVVLLYNVGVGAVSELTLGDCAGSSFTLGASVGCLFPVYGCFCFLFLTELLSGRVEDCIQFVELVDSTFIYICPYFSYEFRCDLLRCLYERIFRCHCWIFMYFFLKQTVSGTILVAVSLIHTL